jgi:hypothetical protein
VCALAARLLPALGGSPGPALLLAAVVPWWLALLMRSIRTLALLVNAKAF